MTESTLAELHNRLSSGELAAAGEIAEHVLERMIRCVTSTSPQSLDRHQTVEACHDALLDYFAAPSAYDPDRSNLLTFLIGRARSKAGTTARGERRRAARENAYATARAIELGDAADASAFNVVLLRELLEEHWPRIGTTEEDAEVFLLIAVGERRCSAYLEALGLDDTRKAVLKPAAPESACADVLGACSLQ